MGDGASKWPRVVVACVMSAAAACTPAPSVPAMAKGCALLAAQCRINQQGCQEDAAGHPTCVRCPDGQYAASGLGTCTAIGGTPMAHDFSDWRVSPGQEIVGLCQSWTLHNAQPIWINAVELTQDIASHHSNWTFTPDTKYPGPDGVWRCSERNYTEVEAAIAGGVLYAQSTQAAHEVQKFPNGAAVRIPPYARIISDVHLLNASDKEFTGHASLTMYSLAEDKVQVKLSPFHLVYSALDIPARSVTRAFGECPVGDDFVISQGRPWDLQIYYALPHTHALGQRVFMQAMGGPADGKMIVDVSGFNSEARGLAFDPPVDLTGASGLRFGCEYTNPRDAHITYGFGDQEMCDLLGFAATTVAFQSNVYDNRAAGTEGPMQLFTGHCSSLEFAYDQNKPGGTGP